MKAKANEPLAPVLAARLVEVLRDQKMEVGAHLPERLFCDLLEVSRTPVRRALALLEGQGLLQSHAGRGYFLARLPSTVAEQLDLQSTSSVELYQQIADDLLTGIIGPEFSERALSERYDAGRGLLKQVLERLFREGLLERKTGHGWRVTPFLADADAHNASYRFRMVIEPAAILEPTFELDHAALARVRAQQEALLAGKIFTLSRVELFELSSHFHETVIRCSRNPNYIAALERQNQQRRLLEYRANADRERMVQQCEEHIQLLDLLESGRREEAATFLRQHLNVVRRIKMQSKASQDRRENDKLEVNM